VRDSEQSAPCHIQVLYGGAVVAEAIADGFRPDLLRAGHGHGHYGFRAQLRSTVPAGRVSLVLHLPRTRTSAAMGVAVPPLLPAARPTIEDLLKLPPAWTTADLLAAPNCLDMPGNYAAMGPDRFVDAVFRFVLGRWPSDAEARHHAASLETGRVTPTGLLEELLRGRERADLDPALSSPFDPAFPFRSG
jgi:hypothetical protein